MRCRTCTGGRRYAKGSVNCIQYGMIIREDHEGNSQYCKEHEGNRQYCKEHEGEEREETKEPEEMNEIEEGWW